MEFLAEYGLFLIKSVTLVAAILITIAGIIAISQRNKTNEPTLEIKDINKKLDHLAETLQGATLDKKDRKLFHKQTQKAAKAAKHATVKPRLFVLHFKGDIKASAVESLREEITVLLDVAGAEDSVCVLLESAGGMVHTYGLAASQLQRITARKIPLTICIDQVAASGGYLMACVADKIIAAPFAIIGSIGVVAQLPNFHRLLKHNHIDFEMITAGEYKRTLTVFGENTDKARQKFAEDLEDIHYIFKDHITTHRPQVNIETVATGEHWLGQRALDLQLVDELGTSDDYLLKTRDSHRIYEIGFKRKEKITEKLAGGIQTLTSKLLNSFAQEERESRLN